MRVILRVSFFCLAVSGCNASHPVVYGDGGPRDGRDAATGDDDAGVSACVPIDEIDLPVDEDLQDWEFAFGLAYAAEIAQGTSRTFQVGVRVCCYAFEFIDSDVCVSYELVGANGIATVDQEGMVTVAAGAPVGSSFDLRADLGDESVWLSITVSAADPPDVVGCWRETAHLSCADDSIVATNDGLEEFSLTSGNRFAVTWNAFEVYQDYWGDYEVDGSTIRFSVEDGNRLFGDADLDGTFEVSDDRSTLTLRSVFFGDFQDRGEPVCGYVFRPGANCL